MNNPPTTPNAGTPALRDQLANAISDALLEPSPPPHGHSEDCQHAVDRILPIIAALLERQAKQERDIAQYKAGQLFRAPNHLIEQSEAWTAVNTELQKTPQYQNSYLNPDTGMACAVRTVQRLVSDLAAANQRLAEQDAILKEAVETLECIQELTGFATPSIVIRIKALLAAAPSSPTQYIRILRATDASAWYATRIDGILPVERIEYKVRHDQGIPADVFWCREGGTFNALNYILFSDAVLVDAPRDGETGNAGETKL